MIQDIKFYKNNSNILESGFTLVELSIVLVIIGLIISSVLVGQDLVKSAELRSTITQYEGFNAAVGTFKGKYNGLPGDILGATNFGFTGDGDADGSLSSSTDLQADSGSPPTGENVDFWSHLGSSSAALISGAYAGASVIGTSGSSNIAGQLPAGKVGNYWGVYTSSGANYYYLGVVGAASGVYATSNTLTPLEARNIDDKVDDGKPAKGIVQAKVTHATNADTAITTGAGNGFKQNASPGDAFCTTSSFAAYDGNAAYHTKTTSIECNLRFKMPF